MKDVAALYLRTGHLAEGFQWFARVTELDPNDVHAWSAVALLLVQADRLEDATVAIRQALTVDAQDKRALQVAEMIIAKWRERGVDPTTQMATPATAPSATQPAPVAAEPEVGQGIEQGP
jgi:cytochrome c-type biogenesis protein CcmH/NrfG